MCDNRLPEELGIDLNEYPVDYSIFEVDNLKDAPKGLYHIGVYHNSSGCARWVKIESDGTQIWL